VNARKYIYATPNSIKKLLTLTFCVEIGIIPLRLASANTRSTFLTGLIRSPNFSLGGSLQILDSCTRQWNIDNGMGYHWCVVGIRQTKLTQVLELAYSYFKTRDL